MTERTRSQESEIKTVYTTGEAAKICQVSQQTIIRCFDSGDLPGFRVPGSRFRRIPRDVLYRFMKENGIPTDTMESPASHNKIGILATEGIRDALGTVLEGNGNRTDFITYNSTFDMGMRNKEWPNTLVVDDRAVDSDASMLSIASTLHALRGDAASDVRSLAILSEAMSHPSFDEIVDIGCGDDACIARRIVEFHEEGQEG